MPELSFPDQPIYRDGSPDKPLGRTWRFKPNAIVEKLLAVASANGYDLNKITIDVHTGKFAAEDLMQLDQLIGYSVFGYGELSYVTDEAYARAAAEVVRQGGTDPWGWASQ